MIHPVDGSAKQRTLSPRLDKTAIESRNDRTESDVRQERRGEDCVLESETKTCASKEDDEMSILEQEADLSVHEASSESWEVGGVDEDDTGVTYNDKMHEDMTSRRQQTLREIAAYDRIGGDYRPPATVPPDLIAKLQKRKDDFVRDARERRAPFEKYQEFDAFIDELTVLDDQSWKTVRLVRHPEQPP